MSLGKSRKDFPRLTQPAISRNSRLLVRNRDLRIMLISDLKMLLKGLGKESPSIFFCKNETKLEMSHFVKIKLKKVPNFHSHAMFILLA